jgi:serine/threonine-protein kinase
MATIGRYELRGELGRGGMARVYRAYDPNFRREVALKVLTGALLDDEEFHARFRREAETIAALEHPAIVPVYDFGEHEGQPYLVMRLMPGGSLADRLTHGPLPDDQVLRVLGQLAPALDYAHAAGVIHRDLKPGNVLFDQAGNAYLGDFGLAKLAVGGTQLSATGLMGTPAYMSPEQARGEKDLDARTDVYALGAMMYQTLTGRLPYDADTPIGVALKHVTDPVPTLRETRPDLPAACEQVLATAMAKLRDRRYATASALVRALGQAMTRGAGPEPPSRPEPLATWVDPERAPAPIPGASLKAAPAARRMTGVWLGVGAAALVVLGLGALGVSWVVFNLINPASATPTVAALVTATAELPVTEPAPTEAVTREAPGTDPAPIASATLAVATAAPSATPAYEPGQTRVVDTNQNTQVFVPGGTFIMGRDDGPADERPAHEVTLADFWLDQSEVSNFQYSLCVVSGACTEPAQPGSITRPVYYGDPEHNQYPIIHVSWVQADQYCAWAGRRLPTEAEWERAARGDDGRLYPWGNDAPNPERLNFGASGFGDTRPILDYASASASPYGIWNMAGNVWEWVADYYDPGYYAVAPAFDPQGPERSAGPPDACDTGECRVLRGGAWDSTAEQVRVTTRLLYGANDGRDGFGFRCAQDR